jgi:ATP-dependent exoDNAse (exonuclease V) beta subunit
MRSLFSIVLYSDEAENFATVLATYVQGMQLKRHIDATLGSGNLREAVRLPIGEDLNEWLAVNSN